METLRYPPRRLVADYVRSAAGLAVTTGLVLGLDLAPFVAAVLVALSGLFAALLVLTLRRQRLRIALDEHAISALPTAVEIPWSALTGLTLRYYGSRGDPPVGELHLSLSAGARRIRVDSRLDGFHRVAARAARAAREASLGLEPVTAGNLAQLERAGYESRPGAGSGLRR